MPTRRGTVARVRGVTQVSTMETLPEEIQRLIFGKLCNLLHPRLAVDFSLASKRLSELMHQQVGASKSALQELKDDNEMAAGLIKDNKIRQPRYVQCCEALRKDFDYDPTILWNTLLARPTVADLATLGKMCSVLPALENLYLLCGVNEPNSAPNAGLEKLAKNLGVGALPAVIRVRFVKLHLGEAGASALAAALVDRGAMRPLEHLELSDAAISDAALVALAPALRQLPALESLCLAGNPFSDEGLAALVAPPQPPPAGAPPPPAADAPPPPAEVLTKLSHLDLDLTQITDAGCADLASRLATPGALPALASLMLHEISASEERVAAVYAARDPLASELPEYVPSSSEDEDEYTEEP